MQNSAFRGSFNLRRLITAVATTGAMLLGLTSNAMAYTVTVTPQSQSASVGSQVSVSIFASDLMQGSLPGGLGSYNFDLSFEAGVLGFNSITDGFGMGNAFGLMWGLEGNVLTVTDTALDDPDTLLATQGQNFSLFTVVFDALGEGTSFLNIAGVVLSDAWGGSEFPVDINNGSVTVTAVTTPVPEPGVWGLMLLGAVMVAWTKRRRSDDTSRTRLSGLDSLALKG